jgi:hypothetical protein
LGSRIRIAPISHTSGGVKLNPCRKRTRTHTRLSDFRSRMRTVQPPATSPTQICLLDVPCSTLRRLHFVVSLRRQQAYDETTKRWDQRTRRSVGRDQLTQTPGCSCSATNFLKMIPHALNSAAMPSFFAKHRIFSFFKTDFYLSVKATSFPVGHKGIAALPSRFR